MIMKKKSLKHEAQNALLQSMQLAFCDLDNGSPLWIAADKQMCRVEKMFGYEPGSWVRGC